MVLLRAPQESEMVVILPNQDSYSLEPAEVRRYLKLLGVPEETKGFVDYTWNFQGCKVDLTNMIKEPLSLEQAFSFMKRGEKVEF